MNYLQNNRLLILIGAVYIVLTSLTIYFFDGTGESGDSVFHYLYARYAPVHPELFFNHWAKPLFVLLASPFAQFGFDGMIIFNVLATLISIILTCKIAESLHFRNSILSTLLLIFAPYHYILTFSGLTEPLFELFLILGIYLCIRQKYVATALFISFIPFVRSEGLIILGVFGFYYLLKGQWKLLPLFLFGHIVYSIAGYFVYHDFLWVFTKIPYAKLNSIYGSGELFRFVKKLRSVAGVPIYILFWFGFLSITWRGIKKKIILEEHVLIFLNFTAFFVAHSLFWYFGIFGSMGLERVLLGVMPLIALIALQGYNFITEDLPGNKKTLKGIIKGALIAYVIIFPFTSNPAAINFKTDFSFTPDQKAVQEIARFIRQQPPQPAGCVFSADTYVSMALNIDPFDPKEFLFLTKENLATAKTGDLVVWDNWYAPTEFSVKKEDLDRNPNLINIYNLKHDNKGAEILYSVYKRK